MPNVAVIGAQWGDEGKGKITDYLAESADIIVRPPFLQRSDSSTGPAATCHSLPSDSTMYILPAVGTSSFHEETE